MRDAACHGNRMSIFLRKHFSSCFYADILVTIFSELWPFTAATPDVLDKRNCKNSCGVAQSSNMNRFSCHQKRFPICYWKVKRDRAHSSSSCHRLIRLGLQSSTFKLSHQRASSQHRKFKRVIKKFSICLRANCLSFSVDSERIFASHFWEWGFEQNFPSKARIINKIK